MISCEDFNTNINDKIIARVDNNSYLYLSDFQETNYSFKTNEDSLLVINSYINKWALRQILLRQSQINLPEEKLNKIDDLVESYKFDLITNNYTEFLVSSKLDTIIAFNETL